MKIKKDLLNLLSSFDNLTFETEKNDVLVIKSKLSNQIIKVCFWDKEHSLFFNQFHWHFDNSEEENQYLIETILDIIGNSTRLQEVYVNDRLKSSTLEFKNENGEWESGMKTSVISFNFLKKKREIKYKEVRF